MEPFLGEIRIFAGNFAPDGWNMCDGTLLSISSNDALYALIGTTYGGDGQSTFALPDLRGRVPVHQGQGQGLSQYIIGQVGGTEEVTLITNQMPSHNHLIVATTEAGKTNDPTGAFLGAALDTCKLYLTATPADTAMDPSMIGPSTGGNQPHENRQSFLAMNYIIALAGVFPSQN